LISFTQRDTPYHSTFWPALVTCHSQGGRLAQRSVSHTRMGGGVGDSLKITSKLSLIKLNKVK